MSSKTVCFDFLSGINFFNVFSCSIANQKVTSLTQCCLRNTNHIFHIIQKLTIHLEIYENAQERFLIYGNAEE